MFPEVGNSLIKKSFLSPRLVKNAVVHLDQGVGSHRLNNSTNWGKNMLQCLLHLILAKRRKKEVTSTLSILLQPHIAKYPLYNWNENIFIHLVLECHVRFVGACQDNLTQASSWREGLFGGHSFTQRFPALFILCLSWHRASCWWEDMPEADHLLQTEEKKEGWPTQEKINLWRTCASDLLPPTKPQNLPK